jgi:serine phosphatase RsbU (regulator of sigma subunit)
MPDAHPPKPSSRAVSGKIPVSSLKPGSSTSIRPATGTRRAPPPASEGGAEVVVSSDSDHSTVRRRVSGGLKPRGLSLRWKILLAMTGITVVTAILIFVVVYSKAVGQLSGEIDNKGVRLVKTLASIDAQYWLYAIYQSRGERQSRLDHLLQELFGANWGDSTKSQVFRTNADLRRAYEQLTTGPEKRETAQKLMTGILDALLTQTESEPLRQRLRTQYDAAYKNERWQGRLQALVDPFAGELRPLQGRDIGPGHAILQMSVLDVTTPDGGSVQAVQGQGEKGLSIRPDSKRSASGVEIKDGRDNSTMKEIRLFTMKQAAPTGQDLSYNVILSLEEINDAKGALMAAIFLPIFVSVLLGTGIAFWISSLITEPIKTLIRDIQEVSQGNLDHQTVAVSKDEVGLLATTFNRMTTALRAAHDQEIQSKALEHDLAIASEIQSNLVPKRMLKVPGYDISAYYRPSKEVGGDYYDFIQIGEDYEGIIVADVSGKGVPGSLVMTMARAFIRMEAERTGNVSPADTLSRANKMLAQDIKKGMFVTALYCILNKRTNEVRVASAGHNPLIIWRAAANEVRLVNPNGMALGIDKGPLFERSIKEEVLTLAHGDRLVAFTDGTVEAMNAENQEFGDKRFYQLVLQLATRDSNQMLNLLVKALDEHKGDAPQSDDITIVTLRYL